MSKCNCCNKCTYGQLEQLMEGMIVLMKNEIRLAFLEIRKDIELLRGQEGESN